jgi:hypothetical protein
MYSYGVLTTQQQVKTTRKHSTTPQVPTNHVNLNSKVKIDVKIRSLNLGPKTIPPPPSFPPAYTVIFPIMCRADMYY